MKVYYYSIDGNEVIGPHTFEEIRVLVSENILNADSYLCKSGDPQWSKVSQYEELLKPLPTVVEQEGELETRAISLDDEDRSSTREEELEIKERRPGRHQLLRKIRGNLDALWAAQRESIIARIKDEDLDTEYEATRKRHKELFEEIEESAIEYWRRSGILKEWISDLTWNNADLTLKLKKDASEDEKFEQVMKWLEEKEISSLPGVYCFRNVREYIYIGEGKSLAVRIKQHQQKTFFTYATHFRVVIPNNKRHLKRLERLLIMNRQPSENIAPGSIRGNPADDCLDFIRGEIRELITDF